MSPANNLTTETTPLLGEQRPSNGVIPVGNSDREEQASQPNPVTGTQQSQHQEAVGEHRAQLKYIVPAISIGV
jgi:hypothetical protein